MLGHRPMYQDHSHSVGHELHHQRRVEYPQTCDAPSCGQNPKHHKRSLPGRVQPPPQMRIANEDSSSFSPSRRLEKMEACRSRAVMWPSKRPSIRINCAYPSNLGSVEALYAAKRSRLSPARFMHDGDRPRLPERLRKAKVFDRSQQSSVPAIGLSAPGS